MVDFNKLTQKRRRERGLVSLCQGFSHPVNCPVCEGRGCVDVSSPNKRKRAYDSPDSPEPEGDDEGDPGKFHDDPPTEGEDPEDGKNATVEGRVDRIVAERDGWTAGRLYCKDREPKGVSFSGSVSGLQVGSTVKLQGSWETHPKYGRQFKARMAEIGLPTDAEGFVSLLMSEEAFKGIGPVRARGIIQTIEARGWALEEALQHADKRAWIAQSAKVPAKVMELLADKWKENAAANKAKAKLLSFGISPPAMEKLAKRFGGSHLKALETVEDDPFFLFREVEGFGFQSADEVAQRMGVKRTAEVRLRAGVLEAIERGLADGHTWAPRGEALAEAYKVLGLHETRERDKLKDVMAKVSTLGNGDIEAFEIEGERALGRSTVVAAERGLLEGFVPGKSAHRFLHGTLEKLAEFEPRLNEKQKDAVIGAMGSNRLVITGAAGCGKTFTIATIVREAEISGLIVAVCAPTGKAAKRLEEMFAKNGMNRGASTVHRLLGFKGSHFAVNKDQPLQVDMLICDEASMLDVRLARAVIDALPAKATLILVGDEEQIPPVGPGAVLRDLVHTKLCPIVRLVDVVRQAGELRVNSLKLLKGKLSETAEVDAALGISPWVVVDDKRSDREVLETLLMLFERRLQKMGADALSKIQVISPQRKGKVGVENLNVELQRLTQWVLYEVEVPDKGNTQLLVGDKVMQTRNNYELDIMNGDQGIVVSRGEKDIVVEFGSGVSKRNVVVPRGESGALVLAYAITVHKSQGSEWDFIICICHRTHSFMWHRNLLYTAVTRSSLATCVLGDEQGMKRALKNVDAQKRRTLLSSATETDFTPELNPALEKAPSLEHEFPACPKCAGRVIQTVDHTYKTDANAEGQVFLCMSCYFIAPIDGGSLANKEDFDAAPPECPNCGRPKWSFKSECSHCGHNPSGPPVDVPVLDELDDEDMPF